jgi:acetylcholinesterase
MIHEIFIAAELRCSSQDLLLAVTNTHEGEIFVDKSMTLDIADYISTLFPNFGPAQAAGAAKIYQDLGNNVNQANLAVAECAYVLKQLVPCLM